MKEKELQTNIIRLASIRGWQHYHTFNSQKSARGWPDLVLCRPPDVLFVELKSAKGVMTPYQVMWLDMLKACGLRAFVWKPKDWLNGEVEKVLM